MEEDGTENGALITSMQLENAESKQDVNLQENEKTRTSKDTCPTPSMDKDLLNNGTLECNASQKDTKKEIIQSDNKANENAIKDLRAQLKKALTDQKETKLLLDIYKRASKDKRDKANLMLAEHKACKERDVLKARLMEIQTSPLKATDTKIKFLKDEISQLKNQVSELRNPSGVLSSFSLPEQEALMNEMEVTGRALEDTQELNIQLKQQLEKKENSYCKLMTDRNKFKEMHKIAQAERNILSNQVTTLRRTIDLNDYAVSTLKKKVRYLETSLRFMPKNKYLSTNDEVQIKDLKLELRKCRFQMNDAQKDANDKTKALEKSNHQLKRLQRDIGQLRRRMKALKASLRFGLLDKVMKEYNGTLLCAFCKSKKKCAIIKMKKCFHVLCCRCLLLKYDTIRRECPKCNVKLYY